MALWEDILGNVGAGAYSLLNSALFGGPDLLVKTASSDAYKALQDFREKNPIGSTIGDVAGFLAPTGGALFKGAGKVVGGLGKVAGKAGALASAAPTISKIGAGLTKAGRLVSGADKATDFLSLAGKGALGALEQAVPRAMTTGDYTGLAPQAVIGGLAGGVLGKALPAVAKKYSGKVKDAVVGGQLGAKSRDLTGSLSRLKGMSKAPGGKIAAATRMKDELYDIATKGGVRGEKKTADFLAGQDRVWSGIDKKVADAGLSLGKARESLMKQPGIAKMLAKGETGRKFVDETIDYIDSLADMPTKRAALRELSSKQYGTKATVSDMMEAAAANDLRKTYDKMISEVAPEFTEAVRLYPATGVLKEGAKRRAVGLSPLPASPGSDTAAKMLGAGLGATAGGASTGFDINNPETFSRAAMGLVGGGLINKTLPKLFNKGYSAALTGGAVGASKLADKLGRPVSEYLSELAPKAIGRLMPGEGKDEIKPEGLPMAGIDEAAQGVEAATGQPAEEVAAQAEQEVGEELNDKFMGWIDQVLMADWQKKFADKMPFEDFKARIAKATATDAHPNGFDPRLAVNILYKDPAKQKTYLEQYKRLQDLKAIDMGAILDYEGAVNPASDILQEGLKIVGAQDPNYTRQKQALGQLELLLKNISLKPGQDLSKELQNLMQRLTKGALGTKATREEKAQMLEEALQAYGLDLPGLKNLGLYGGIV